RAPLTARSAGGPLRSSFSVEPAPAERYTLSLHDALPIWATGTRTGREQLAHRAGRRGAAVRHAAGRALAGGGRPARRGRPADAGDRKSTRLNSSHVKNSYAVFCLTKKTTNTHHYTHQRRP